MSNNSIMLLETENLTNVNNFSNDLFMLNDIKFSPNRPIIYSGSENNKIKVWDLKTGQELRTLAGHRERVNAVAVTPDGEKIISAADYSGREELLRRTHRIKGMVYMIFSTS